MAEDSDDGKEAEIVRPGDGPAPAGQLVDPTSELPRTVVALPLNQRPVFPTMMLPMLVPAGPLADAVRYAVNEDQGFLAFFLTRSELDDLSEAGWEDIHAVGALGKVLKHQNHESGGIQLFCQVMARFVAEEPLARKPFLRLRGHPFQQQIDTADTRIRALAMAIVTALKDLVQHNPVFAEEIKHVLANYDNIEGPGRLADLAASLTTAKREDIQDVLETFPIVERMEKVLALLAKETELSQLKSKIQNQIEERVSDNQRKFFLNEQLKAIKEELGIETDEKSLEIEGFREAFEERRQGMSDEVVEEVEGELRDRALIGPASSEYGVVRNRLEWLTELPWGIYSEDELDLANLREGLDRDHHGLDDVKERIVEFCAVRGLKEDRGGGIICLVGPPGTGKTSIGNSIARHMNRRFYRFSVGGMRDEAEIKGHRRTYVGALPGKVAQALRRCATMNPVILLDEIDKLARGIQGDPASALLEVLDPEQNSDFLDHYVDVRIDLSQVLFICTANDLGTIPDALRDRMEIIRLPGYVEQEKLAIASRYLVPKQRKEHGLLARDVNFQRRALQKIVRFYAREAGVRQCEQLVAKICRKVATAKSRRFAKKKKKGSGGFPKVTVDPDLVEKYLGKPYLSDDELISRGVPGVVTGLAWTSLGGATLEVEALAIASEEGGYRLTGQLGDVMKESAHLAHSYLRARGEDFGVDAGWFDRHLIHLHVPAGATPKDGPSAGITMATAMLSLALGRPVRRRLGMTGELTLTGRVYPIGGVREKIVAAKRSRLKTVLLPAGNERDHNELPENLRKGIDVHFVAELDQVLEHAGLLGKS